MSKYDNLTVNEVLEQKGLANTVICIKVDTQNSTVILKDLEYGEYVVDFKSLCPKGIIPLHKRRRHAVKMSEVRNKYVGKKVGTALVQDVFYGPDRGYKNRSFFCVFTLDCGHPSVATYAHLYKHRKNIEVCQACCKTTHGERSKVNGERKQRTSTYIFWQRSKSKLPAEYQDYSVFYKLMGDKPSKKSEIVQTENGWSWVDLSLSTDFELNLMAQALRSAFRHSNYYKTALAKARVETSDGTRYRCALCLELFKQKDVQVDHIDPVSDISGNALEKHAMIDKIWTDKIQVLDRACHSKKSAAENKVRRLNKRNKSK